MSGGALTTCPSSTHISSCCFVDLIGCVGLILKRYYVICFLVSVFLGYFSCWDCMMMEGGWTRCSEHLTRPVMTLCRTHQA